MKMNFVVPIIAAVLLGYLCATFIFNQYGIGSFVFSESKNIYYLQCGAFDTEEASMKKIEGLSNKITVKDGERYYSYVGMTRNLELAEKIKKLYQEKGIDIYIKEMELENDDFLNELDQYDVLLKESKTIEEINSVLKTILATYDEIVLSS